MSTADIHFHATASSSGIAVPVIGRTTLALIAAGGEGIVAGAIVTGTAFVYHMALLHMPMDGFAWRLYLAFGILAGALHGGFSAVACSRFLRGTDRQRSSMPDSIYAWTAAVALTLLTAFLIGAIGDLSRVSLTSAYVIGLPVMLSLRSAAQATLSRRIARGELHFQRVAIIGQRRDLTTFLLHGDLWRQGHQVSNTLYLEDAFDAAGRLDVGAISEFAKDSLTRRADTMLIVGGLDQLATMEPLLNELKRYALDIAYAPATANRSLKFLDVMPIGANNALRFVKKPLSDVSVVLKRASDLVLAIIGIVVLLPLCTAVAVAIKLDSPGPVIFRQARRGFNGTTFMIWKFRSMRVMESGHAMVQATRGDARVTKIGRIIRATSIDELPQLVNVLLGHMSIVGPRPHAISHDDELGKVLATYAHRQRIKPGITGWAQVNGFRGDTQTFAQVEGRTVHDLHYIDNWSILLDFWIIVLTVFSASTHRNAH
jgi:Undecaprenyl-phosphate glucose phosphotransferase